MIKINTQTPPITEDEDVNEFIKEIMDNKAWENWMSKGLPIKENKFKNKKLN